LKANLFNKDFKKQVLAADALKAWVLDNPNEVCAVGLTSSYALAHQIRVLKAASGMVTVLQLQD
jgi:hypothetical protein